MKKKILGIAVLLALVAMCLTLVACPPLDEDVYVRFENKTKIKITITCKGMAPIDLPAATMTSSTPVDVGPGKGSIVLQTITFDNSIVQDNPETYIEVTGSLIPGKKNGKEAQGLSLAGGTCIFNANQAVNGNPAAFKISVLP